MTELSIELATESDLPAVMTLLLRCTEEMRRQGIDQWDDIYPTRERFLSDVSGGSLYVASMGVGKVVASFALDEKQDAEYGSVPWSMSSPRVAVVHRLMVDPDFQGRGTARKVMGFAERAASRLGCEVMRLDAFTKNPQALRLYQVLGYRDAGPVVFRKGVFRCFEKRLDPVTEDVRAEREDAYIL